MTWGGKQNDAKDAMNQLSYAFDRGINWFDTAEIYAIPPTKETAGNTDRCIAPWLAKQDRSKVIVATKVAGYGNDFLRANGDITRITKAQVKESVEGSLKRLGTDYIDLLQVSKKKKKKSFFYFAFEEKKNEKSSHFFFSFPFSFLVPQK